MDYPTTPNHQGITKTLLVPLAVMLSVLFCFLTTKYLDFWIFDDLIRIITGLIVIVYIPGEIIATIVLREKRPRGFGIVTGLLLNIIEIQLLFILTISFGIIVPLDIWLSASSLILFVIVTLSNPHILENLDLRKRFDTLSDKYDARFILVIILGLAVRFVFIPIGLSSFAPDAGLYFDYARNVNDGIFQSNIANDGAVMVRTNTVDEIVHQSVCYLYSLSYMFTPVEGVNPTLILVLFGVLLILVTYEITERFFSKSCALISSVLVAIHPTLVYFSVVGYGPEIISLVFLLYMFLIIQSSAIPKKTRFMLSGFLLVVVESIWYTNFMVAMFVIPIVLVFQEGKISHRTLLITFLLFTTLVARQFNEFILLFTLLWGLIFAFLVISKKRVSESRVHEFTPLFGGIFLANLIFYLPSQILKVLIHSDIPNVGLTALPRALISVPTIEYLFGGVLIVGWHLTPVVGILVLIGLKSLRRNSVFLTLFAISVAIVIGSALVLYSIEPMQIQNLYTTARFGLHVITLSCILAGVVLSQIILRTNKTIPSLPVTMDEGLRIKTIGAVAIIITASFVPGYVLFQTHATYLDPIERYGWHDVQEWVNQNTNLENVFLVNRAREFAWMTERHSVFLNLPENQPYEWNATLALLELANTFSAEYLLMDFYTFIQWDHLEYLLRGPIMQNTSVMLNATECSSLLNRTQSVVLPSITLEMETVPNSDGFYVRIFSFSEQQYNPLWRELNLTDGWEATNGQLSLDENNKTELTIQEDGFSEIHRVGSQQLNLDIESGFLMIDLDSYNTNITNIVILDDHGNILQIAEGVTDGIYYAPLGNCTIGDIIIRIEGSSGESITINEIAIWQEM